MLVSCLVSLECVPCSQWKRPSNSTLYLPVQSLTIDGDRTFTSGTGVEALASCCKDSKVVKKVHRQLPLCASELSGRCDVPVLLELIYTLGHCGRSPKKAAGGICSVLQQICSPESLGLHDSADEERLWQGHAETLD